MKLCLLSLAIGTFALGIAEFTMMGILGDIARDIQISIPSAGQLISAYAFGVSVGAPGLLLIRKMPLKRIMLILAAIITVGNALIAVSPDFHTMLVSRFISGLPHGAFFGAGAIVCSRLSPGRGASAVAIMVGGMTVANIIGVPAATYIAGVLSWRGTFAIVSLLGICTLSAILLWMPSLPSLPDTGLKGQFRFLGHGGAWLIYAGVFFGQASVYCWFCYIEPVMTQITGFHQSAMTWIMVVAGIGMFFGNFLAGYMADRHHPALVSGMLTAAVVVIMPGLYLLAGYEVPSVILMFCATACLFGIGGPAQYMIVKFSKGGEMLGGAGIQIAFNVANAVAALIGGFAIRSGGGFQSPALLGLPLAAIGATAFFVLYRRYCCEDSGAVPTTVRSKAYQ